MGYSTNKPYQRSTYRAPTDGSYDRYLKSGTMVGNKESVLEKPYKVSTYAQMQQDFNIPIPPSFDWGDLPVIPGMDLPPPPGDIVPIGGTGALTCYWTSTGCEQLVGCWAGSDLVLDGPEAATAGYMTPQVIAGEIVQTTISGAENRGIDFVLNPLVSRNTFTVSFKDANGVIASQTIDIECQLAVSLLYSIIDSFAAQISISKNSSGVISAVVRLGSALLKYTTFDGSTWSTLSTIDDSFYSNSYFQYDISKDVPRIIAVNLDDYSNIRLYEFSGGVWNSYSYTAGSGAFFYTNLTVDSLDNPHVVVTHYLSGTYSFKHLYISAGNLVLEDIVTIGTGIGSLSLLYSTFTNTSNTIYFGYIVVNSSDSDQNVYIVSGTTGSWNSPEVVLALGTTGGYAYGGLTNVSNSPHIAITHDNNTYYLVKSGTWSSTNIGTALRNPRIVQAGIYIFITGYEYISFSYYYRALYLDSSWQVYYSSPTNTESIGGVNFSGELVFSDTDNALYRVDVLGSVGYVTIHYL